MPESSKKAEKKGKRDKKIGKKAKSV